MATPINSERSMEDNSKAFGSSKVAYTKSKKKLLLSFLLILGIVFASLGFVDAAECSSGVVEDCTISVSQTLPYGLYNLNDTGGNGTININGTDLTLDGAGSTFMGNFSSNSLFLTQNLKNNITIKNLKIEGYFRSIFYQNSNNITFQNITFGNQLNAGVYLRNTSDILFKDNTFKTNQSGGSSDASGKILLDLNPYRNITFINNYFETNQSANVPIFLRINQVFEELYFINNTIYFSNAINQQVDAQAIRINFLASNILLEGNNFTGGSSVKGLSTVLLNNSIIRNNLAVGGDYFVTVLNATNLSIINNNLTSKRVLSLTDTFRDVYIINNSINNVTAFTSFNAQLYLSGNGSNILVESNDFYNSTGTSTEAGNFIRLRSLQFRNITFKDNTFKQGSLMINLLENIGEDLRFINNSFTDHYGNSDSYSNSFLVYSTNNILFDGNHINNSCGAMVFHNSSYVQIKNNRFDISLNEMLNNKIIQCAYEPLGAILLQELWKTHIPFSISGETPTTSFTSKYASNNFTIQNNNFGNYPVKLRLQGATNVTNDLSNYWYRSFTAYEGFLNKEEWYISDSWNNVTTLFNTTNTNPLPYLSNTLGNGWRASLSTYITYELFNKPNYMRINNTNATTTQQVNLFGLVDSLILFENNSVRCLDINSCDGNVNITLTPNNYSYVLDNFNLTEGTSRQFSPLWFSSSSSTQKTISSNLSQSITATVVVNIPSCDSIENMRFTSSTGSSYILTNEGDFTCENNVATIASLQDIGAGTNTLSLMSESQLEQTGICQDVYDSMTAFFGVTPKLMLLVGVVLLVSMIGMFIFIVRRMSDESSGDAAEGMTNIGITVFIILFIILMIFFALVLVTSILCNI